MTRVELRRIPAEWGITAPIIAWPSFHRPLPTPYCNVRCQRLMRKGIHRCYVDCGCHRPVSLAKLSPGETTPIVYSDNPTRAAAGFHKTSACPCADCRHLQSVMSPESAPIGGACLAGTITPEVSPGESAANGGAQ